MNVWITGASSGIGEACAYQYARMGCALILTATNEERLDRVAEHCLELGAGGVKLIPYDLSDNEGVSSLVTRAWEAFGCIETVLLNAGISQRTKVEDTNMSMVRQLMEINFFAPVAIAKALLPLMVNQGGGHIAVTSSIAGLFGFPLRCGYSASKHALYGYFESLQAEYYDQDIRVTMVCPGRIQTNISLRALDKGGKPYGKLDPGQAGGMNVDKAARQIVRAIQKSKREVYVGGKELLMAYIKRFFPGLCARLSRRISAV